MAAIQLNFTLRTSAQIKSVHLLGSWDGYKGQLPLSKDTSKSGGWKGTFRFQGQTLKQGQRYWYYYIIDGYHVSHDPARECVTEPTTGRKLNILDIPTGKPAATETTASSRDKSNRHSRRTSTGVPKGRPLARDQIQSPKPVKPLETAKVRREQFQHPTLEQLTAKFAAQQIQEDDSDDSSEDDSSDAESDVPSLSSRSSNSSTPSSVSSTSSCCTCERYGITRAGARVKLDCGGSRCGSSDGSECSSESEDDYKRGTTRRHGIVVRT